MKTVTVREAQHHLSKVLAWVARGETVLITRYRQVVAKLVPAKSKKKKKVEQPDWLGRLKEIYGDKVVKGPPASKLLDQMRDEEQGRFFS